MRPLVAAREFLMHLTRKGFNLVVLLWLAPIAVMSLYGNMTTEGALSDLYFYAFGASLALAAFAGIQMMRDDYTANGVAQKKTPGRPSSDLVNLENVGALEYVYCAVLCLIAVGAFFFHHHVNKETTGLLSLMTLIYSYFDFFITAVSGYQFWTLKGAAVKAAAQKASQGLTS
jgi:hypothetical protein